MLRSDFLNYLIDARQYRSYLEIGCDQNVTFDAIRATLKVGVDPIQGGTVTLTSDAFFLNNTRQFDLVFIDGLHLKEQVLRDVDNALRCLSSNGTIVLHDCLPTMEQHQERTRQLAEWTGDVWKAAVEIRGRQDLDMATLNIDWGLGVIVRRPNSAILPVMSESLTWSDYVVNRDYLLRVMDFDDMREFIN